MASEASTPKAKALGWEPFILLAAALLISACGLIYELIAGALASYLMGDTLTRFSTVIGTYLFAMGIGAWLARFVKGDPLARFVEIEIATGLIGGFSALILFTAFAANAMFQPLLYALVLMVGMLVGIEIPLLLRLLKSHLEFEDLVSRVLSLDYLGALIASLVFPFWFVPHLGLVRTGIVFGILNIVVALATLWFFRARLRGALWWGVCAMSLVSLSVAFVYAERFTRQAEEKMFRGQVVLAEQTPYQRIALLQKDSTLRLYLNGRLQFSSRDEHRYHEALVHPAMASLREPKRVLVLGGGDGMAVREVLRYSSVQSVTVVDLDAAMTDLFRQHDQLKQLNGSAFSDSRVSIVNQDAWRWLEALPLPTQASSGFDAIVMDLPDPSNFALGRLYSVPFFRLLKQHLREGGLIVTQATSPETVREAFWCIVNTLEATGLRTAPYHVFIPSFGGWGFVIASEKDPSPTPAPQAWSKLPQNLKYLTEQVLPTLFVFSPDIARMSTEANHLDSQILVSYYDRAWRKARY